ncbi:MliC family protein [Halomonas sp. I1]|uniref:COG3650 family protein n=1 Tax=Halomonas sp. I1 TaxID=393536 RepID=UPI0028DEE1DB|nr:MliC family protein [Halomonas sp. I1]MDT8896462.1 MliC family protein [Halomonas sp. I1]
MPRIPVAACRHLGASLLILGLAGCAASSPEPDVAPPPPKADTSGDAARAPLLPSALFPGDAEHVVGWRCTPDQGLVTAHNEDDLRLWSAHGAYRLNPAVVASGDRYEQGELSFWSKGDEAVVESSRGRLECRQDTRHRALTRASHPDVMFQARGNEPGWHIELANDTPRIAMSLDYGEREVTLPYRVTSLDNETGRVTLASGQAARPFELRIEARACFDDMSGQPWPARVTLTLNDRVYRGCGQGIAP